MYTYCPPKVSPIRYIQRVHNKHTLSDYVTAIPLYPRALSHPVTAISSNPRMKTVSARRQQRLAAHIWQPVTDYDMAGM